MKTLMKTILLFFVSLFSFNSFADVMESEWQDLFGEPPLTYEIEVKNAPQELEAYYLDEFPCTGSSDREFKAEPSRTTEFDIECVTIPKKITFAYIQEEKNKNEAEKPGDADGVMRCNTYPDEEESDTVILDLSDCESVEY